LSSSKSVKAEVLKGPFDPGGQPERSRAQPIDLSLFAWNVRSGLTASKAVLSDPAHLRDFWEWPRSKDLLMHADRMGLDSQVQYGMWTGYGGASGWNSAGYDFASAAAACAAITERIGIYSTVHVAYRFHPLHIAKIGASIDSISGGRWGLNIVAGQNPKDFRQFGFIEPPPSAERYAMADEFVTLMKYLWSSDRPVDFEGEFYQAYGAFVDPKPVRRPRPVLMNAGQSPAGFDFACRQADWVFVASQDGDPAGYAELAKDAHSRAERYGRTVGVAAMSYAIIDETDGAAERTARWLEDEVDTEAVAEFIRSTAGTSHEMAVTEDDPYMGVGRDTFMKVAVGMTGYQLIGSYDTVCERIKALYDVGVEHMVICFLDPADGLQKVEREILPRLKRMGLRR
jgi:dimethylsulfone monooxygenase